MPSTTEIVDELKDSAPEPDRKLGRIVAICSILAVAIAGLFWLFTVNATANGADKKSDANAAAIEKKADKDDVRQGFQNLNDRLDKIQEILINGGAKRK